MKDYGLYCVKVISLIVILISCRPVISAQTGKDIQAVKTFVVKTYDNLQLPGQVIMPTKDSKAMLVFINGSTPYDEKGNIGATWNDDGKMAAERHDFYTRFLEIMPSKGYKVATMAKRSFVYPRKLPRPSLNELALDVQMLIEEMKEENLFDRNDKLIIVGYSEGSIVATKVLGLLKVQPNACILLGSGSMAFNYKTQLWEGWYSTDTFRKKLGSSDEQIKKEFKELGQIQSAIIAMDEDEFENAYKNTKPFGFGFAKWESYYIDKEVGFYDPVPNLLYANVPLLLCVGDNDIRMPPALAKRTYDDLQKNGFEKGTLKIIQDEVHELKKYDVFAITDAWIGSGGKTTEFTLGRNDLIKIQEYDQRADVRKPIESLSWEGGQPDKSLECLRKAKESNLADPDLWFKLGLVLFADGKYDESVYALTKATTPTFPLAFASMVWIGHINDLLNNREGAISWYQKALEKYPGFPVQHDQWGITIDKKWIEERLITPFKGIEGVKR